MRVLKKMFKAPYKLSRRGCITVLWLVSLSLMLSLTANVVFMINNQSYERMAKEEDSYIKEIKQQKAKTEEYKKLYESTLDEYAVYIQSHPDQ